MNTQLHRAVESSQSLRRVAIVGSTSGIARAVAQRFASRGSALTLIARSAELLESQAQDLRVRHSVAVSTLVLDLTDDAGREDLPDTVMQETPGQPAPLDGVLIAAGYMDDNDTARTSRDSYASTVHLNYSHLAEIAERFADAFQTRDSQAGVHQAHAPVLAGIASVAGDRGRMSNYVYGAAKAAFATHLDGMRHRLSHDSPTVAVLTIKPGMVDTPMTAGIVNPSSPLVASPERVAKDIVQQMERARTTKRGRLTYTPWFWRHVMRVIRLVPEPIFVKTKL